MDRIINWLILIIIFVFDPLAVALVVAFNNAIRVDSGIVKKDKVIRKRELYDEVPEEEVMDELDNDDEEEEELTELQKTLLMDVEDEEEVLPDEARGFAPPIEEEFDEQDLNKDGEVTEEEQREFYEKGGWSNAYNGKDYWQHPWFDWNKKERWINDRQAINHWLNDRGGNTTALEEIKSQYPTDFNSKTY